MNSAAERVERFIQDNVGTRFVSVGIPYSHTRTGERYRTYRFCKNNNKKSFTRKDLQKMLSMIKEDYKQVLKSENTVLIWRRKPEVVSYDLDTRLQVSMRLTIEPVQLKHYTKISKNEVLEGRQSFKLDG